MRQQIVKIVQNFCKEHNVPYKEAWRVIYKEYGERYHIYPDITYKFGHKSKLDFLEAYEGLYKTLTKLHVLVKQLK